MLFYQPLWMWPKQRPNWECSIRRNKWFIPVEIIKYFFPPDTLAVFPGFAVALSLIQEIIFVQFLLNTMKYWPWFFCQQKNLNVIMVNNNEKINLSVELQYTIQIYLSYLVGTKFRTKFGRKKRKQDLNMSIWIDTAMWETTGVNLY